MRVLLDECGPRPLRRRLPEHDVRTVTQMDWSGKTNGELLGLIRQEAFDVFITVDQNLPYQQNLIAAGVSVVLMIARSNKLSDLEPLVPELIRTLGNLRRGTCTIIGSPAA